MNGFTISVLDSIQTLSQLKIGSAVSADLSPDEPTLYIYPIAVCIIIHVCIVFLLHSFNFVTTTFSYCFKKKKV